eukprot:CAMPEP_0170542130 /NCGR_PEP_ID=MMETSP0211-20121228/1652_1 /TAXON_ID=311385 /ORGANISM="Pseudokeronopsis sp., Strain OXSARD2" /LENGTH=64 /DNA_ID=CAMNT_0010845099 /DNA_START=1022 /DNA_END=1216 /DNA_ORIENTATION=+
MVNTYVKEHFWSYEFIKSLNLKIKDSKGGMRPKQANNRQSWTYEDLQMVKPFEMSKGISSQFSN